MPDTLIRPVSPETLSLTIPGYNDMGTADDWDEMTQEILDTLPKRWTRSLVYVLVAFGTVVVPWLATAEVDEVGAAKGRLEPKGKTFRLDAPIGGKVASVKTKEGQRVRKGDPVIELDTDLMRMQLQQTTADRGIQIGRAHV